MATARNCSVRSFRNWRRRERGRGWREKQREEKEEREGEEEERGGEVEGRRKRKGRGMRNIYFAVFTCKSVDYVL